MAKKNLIWTPITNFDQLNNFLRTLREIMNDVVYSDTDIYTGTGATLNILTGFSPELVIITTDANVLSVLWQKNMPATHSKKFDGVTLTDGILGFTPQRNGFQLGVNALVNTVGTVYRWTAIGK